MLVALTAWPSIRVIAHSWTRVITAPSPTPGEIRALLQMTGDEKTSKERRHVDLETDDVESEVSRLVALGAMRQDQRGPDGLEFWVLRDLWGNEFCVRGTGKTASADGFSSYFRTNCSVPAS